MESIQSQLSKSSLGISLRRLDRFFRSLRSFHVNLQNCSKIAKIEILAEIANLHKIIKCMIYGSYTHSQDGFGKLPQKSNRELAPMTIWIFRNPIVLTYVWAFQVICWDLEKISFLIFLVTLGLPLAIALLHLEEMHLELYWEFYRKHGQQ